MNPQCKSIDMHCLSAWADSSIRDVHRRGRTRDSPLRRGIAMHIRRYAMIIGVANTGLIAPSAPAWRHMIAFSGSTPLGRGLVARIYPLTIRRWIKLSSHGRLGGAEQNLHISAHIHPSFA